MRKRHNEIRIAMTKIRCGTHGKQDETFVCRHIIDAVKEDEPRGFHWNVADGVYQALCTDCNNMSDDEFAAAEADIIATLCFGCFQDAAALNGVDIA